MLHVVKNSGFDTSRKVLVIAPALDRADHGRLRRLVRNLPAQGWNPLLFTVSSSSVSFIYESGDESLSPVCGNGRILSKKESERDSQYLSKFGFGKKLSNIFHSLRSSTALPFPVSQSIECLWRDLEKAPGNGSVVRQRFFTHGCDDRVHRSSAL